MDMDAPALLRLLGDDARLRLLRVLQAERLNVSELTGILGIAQSGVSRHLGLLKEAGLAVEQREGGFTYFQAAPADAANGATALGPFLQSHFETFGRTAAGRADDARLEEVRRLRKENFDAHAGPDTKDRQLVPGRSWAAWARALGHLLPPLRVADLGCGDGYLTIEASRWASRVIAVDRSRAVLARARDLAKRRRVRNVIWKHGEIEKLPLARRLCRCRAALAGAAPCRGSRTRPLRGRAHRRPGRPRPDSRPARARPGVGARRLGDTWLGFSDERLAKLMKQAGLVDVTVAVGSRRPGDPFTVLVASGTKPSAAATQNS